MTSVTSKLKHGHPQFEVRTQRRHATKCRRPKIPGGRRDVIGAVKIALAMVLSAAAVGVVFFRWRNPATAAASARSSVRTQAVSSTAARNTPETAMSAAHVENSVPAQHEAPQIAPPAKSAAIDLPPAPPERRAGEPLRLKEPILTGALRNQGNSTALAAAETLLWGAVNRETNAAASLVMWAYGPHHTAFAAVPAPWREQAGTPERLLAWMWETEFETVGGLEVVDHRVLGPRDEQVRVRFDHADGRSTEHVLIMRRSAAGWQRQQSPKDIEALAGHLRGKKPRSIRR